jgi:hypothetical protein
MPDVPTASDAAPACADGDPAGEVGSVVEGDVVDGDVVLGEVVLGVVELGDVVLGEVVLGEVVLGAVVLGCAPGCDVVLLGDAVELGDVVPLVPVAPGALVLPIVGLARTNDGDAAVAVAADADCSPAFTQPVTVTISALDFALEAEAVPA